MTRVLLLLSLAALAPAQTARQLLHQAEADTRSGKFTQAAENARAAYALCQSAHDQACLASARNAEGAALLYAARYPESAAAFEQALSLFERLHDRMRVIDVLNNLGSVHYYRGEYADALRRYQQAYDALTGSEKESWYDYSRHLTIVNLATIFQRLGRNRAALELYNTLGPEPRGLSAAEIPRYQANLGVLYRRLGDPWKAQETYLEALHRFRTLNDHDGALGLLINLGILRALDFEDYPGAHDWFQKALDLATESGSAREAMQANLYLAETQFRGGDLDGARDRWQSALSSSRALGASEGEWKCLYGLARVSAALGQDGRAGVYFREAARAIESVRARIQGVSLKSEFLYDKRDVYDDWIALEAKQARAPDLFAMMERARSRVLLDQASRAASPDSTSAARLTELRKQISRLYSTPHPPANQVVEVARLEAEYDQAERAARRGWNAGPISLAEFQQRLKDDEAVFLYWLGRRAGYLLWVTRTASGVAGLPVREDQAPPLLAAALDDLESGVLNWQRKIEWLLPAIPIWRESRIRRIWIVPDGVLALAPFDALRVPEDGGWLIERYEVIRLPAAAFLRAAPPSTHTWRWPWQLQMTAFGDPAVTSAPLLPSDSRWGALPKSRQEVLSLRSLLPGRTHAYLASQMTRGTFLREAGLSPLLHIATHAATDPEDGSRSRLLFSGGYLFSGEIFALPLSHVDLVTLSACETERGALRRGEGAQSLSRAFLAAGARTTLATLWKVDDTASMLFIGQFYDALRSGMTKAAALREAKLRFLHSRGELSNPRYWAAFVMQGAAGEPAPKFVSWPALLWPAALLCAAFALLSRRRAQ
ncbi:MAG: CHAT domain-containing protein [Bryobacterales bacterium]|nr:CHAT domain-containing protein [Bryobacterales bacterium]